MSRKPYATPRFICLELLDPEVHALLNGLMHEFGGQPGGRCIHITVRGPYYRTISVDAIEGFQKVLEQYPILIHGAGLFTNPDEFIVYTKVYSENLKQVWRKPDYPIKEYGFNPHLTLYKGQDGGLAKEIYSFLEKENLKLLCYKFRLTTYVSKQAELFPEEEPLRNQHFLEQSNWRLIYPDILQRAENVVSNYNKLHVNNRLQPTTADGD